MLFDLHAALDHDYRPFHLHLSSWVRSGPGWWGALFGMYPRVGEGEIDGHSWWFRARGDRWEVTISSTTTAWAEEEYLDDVPGAFRVRGPYAREGGSAGDMEDREAWPLIHNAFAAWRKAYRRELEREVATWEGEGGGGVEGGEPLS